LIKANSFDPEVFNVKLKEAFAKHTETLSKYVDPSKLDAFKKFQDEKMNVITINKEFRKANFEIRNEIKEIKNEVKKKFLSDKQRENVNKKIKAKSKSFYLKLNEQVDNYLKKTKNDVLKSQLEELKELIQENLDSVSK